MPIGMRVFLGLIVIAEEAGVELSVDDILALYYPQENSKNRGRYSMYPRRKKQVVGEMKNADRYWQNRYFFMLVNEKSLGALANAFYPLWGHLSKELKKPLPKALLFEQKLEQLLAQLCHFSSPKELLARKKAEKEAAKAATAEKAAQGRAFFKKKDLIMRQLLSDVDSDIINGGQIQSHLDEFLWNGLKSNLRAMGSVYRTTDKVVEQKKLVKELEDKDNERGEKLLDIERKFKDVKVSANVLIAELQTVNQVAKEGTNMMKVMADRYDEATAKIKTLEESLKQKEANNFVLVARIINAYERATLKARYDLLKEYKKGLLVDTDVEEEIELFEDSLAEAEDSSSAPIAAAAPTSNEPVPTPVEPPSSVDPSEGRETQ
ncbi:hypothetical protein TIFTF001_017719 [Ficus carica]|uniref:Uncharacterized protein n=1 Tax=Ficus carica TaxID=3494 RepID=A0AA88A2W8_FICCA|nr:hypothetical protein TIFTF001_017719 [Ficus carica]